MTGKLGFVAIGECMIELSGGDDGLWRMGYAGDTLNTAWYARALLDPARWRVAYATRLGRDGFSDRIVQFIADAGIDTSAVTRDPDRNPGLYVIERDGGERRFTYWRDRSAARGLADQPEALAAALAGARIAYFSGITLAILTPDRREALLGALAAARAAGTIVAFDPNIRPRLWEDAATMRAAIMRAASQADIALPSFDDEAAAFGDADPAATAARYHAAGASVAAVKDGPRAVLLSDASGMRDIPAATGARVLDTTGAGDSFNGAFLASWSQGAPVEAAVAAGCRLAAGVVGHPGALMPMDAARLAAAS